MGSAQRRFERPAEITRRKDKLLCESREYFGISVFSQGTNYEIISRERCVHPAQKGKMLRNNLPCGWRGPALQITLLFTVSTLFYLANWNIIGPVYELDEGGYLAKAAALSGRSIDAFSSYYPGYALLLSPAFHFSDLPQEIYQWVKIINALFWGLSAVLLHQILLKLYGGENSLNITTVSIVTILYPSNITMAGYAFPSSAITLFVLITLLQFLNTQKSESYSWIKFGLASGVLATLHPMASIISISAVTILSISAKCQGKALAAMTAAATALVVYISLKLGLDAYLLNKMNTGDFPAATHYPTVSQLLMNGEYPELLLSTVTRVMGQVTYFGLATYGFGFIGLLLLLKDVLHHAPRFFDPINQILATSFLAFAGIASVSSLMFAAGSYGRLDHWMYGRYLEGIILLPLAIGIMQWKPKTFFKCVLLIVFSVLIFSLLAPSKLGQVQNINALGLWQPFANSHSPDLDRVSDTLLKWGAGALLIAATFFLNKWRISRSIVLALCFLGTALLHIKHHENEQPMFVAPKYKIAEVMHLLREPGDCINFDFKSVGMPSWLVFGFYLSEFKFGRFAIGDEKHSCNEVILSPAASLSVAEERLERISTHPYWYTIWADPEKVVLDQINAGCLPGACVRFEAPAIARSNVGQWTSAGIESTGAAGYLLFGPYEPLHKGRYHLHVKGLSRTESGTATLDVVSGNPTIVFASKSIEGILGDISICLPVEIPEDIPRVEVRVLVSKEIDISITEYELSKRVICST